MNAPVVRLDELGALDLLASPVWIVDFDLGARTWVRVLRLRGVSPAFSGIRPGLARAIVEAGLDLAGVRCHQSLADALRGPHTRSEAATQT